MDEKTEKALREEREVWVANAQVQSPLAAVLGYSNRPLCRQFFTTVATGCSNCPVKKKTSHDACWATPYTKARTAYIDWTLLPGPENGDAFRRHASEMAEFLRDLLPREEG